MLKNEADLESSIQSLYQFPQFLNPTWRVIYQEAVRGHHIIFDSAAHHPSPQLTLERGRVDNPKNAHTVEETFMSMLLSSDMNEIRRIAQSLSAVNYQFLYHIYLRTIQSWSWELRASLN